MPLTAYTDIIPLIRAKKYLKLDDPELPHPDDDEVEEMINGALEFIEGYTNHIMYARDFTGHTGRIYNYPLNSITGFNEDDLSHYYQRNMDKCGIWPSYPDTVDYNAGYTELDQVPKSLVQAALQMLKVWYFESEKQVNTTLIPMSVMQTLDQKRRFV
jgi:hypothetical protein